MAADHRAQQAQPRAGSPLRLLPEFCCTVKKMAALTRHGSLAKNTLYAKGERLILAAYDTAAARMIVREKQSKTKTAAKFRIESEKISLATRGFLRPVQPYQPSSDVSERLDKIVMAEGIPDNDETIIKDPMQRVKLFLTCAKEFKYTIPNSLLHTIKTIGDLKCFYKKAVDTTVPLDAMVKKDLPPNLHVQTEYHRFHPDTDTLFDGKTAFPSSSTLVTGLKYKKKYKGHVQKNAWLSV